MKVRLLNQLEGLNTNVSPFLQPENSPTVLNAVNVSHKLGAMLKDPGYSQVGDAIQAGKDVTGLFDFHQDPDTQKILATINNSADTNLVLAYNNAGTWTDISLSNAWDTFENSIVDMEGFIGHCFFVGRDATDGVFLPVGSLTGTTFSTSANVTNMAQGKYIIRYRDRLYVANARSSGTNFPFRVYFSSVPSSGAITWTPASDFLDVDYGREITGMGTNWDRLAIFTEDRTYLYDQSQFKQAWSTGCSNNRTIRSYAQYMFFCNYDGVWVSTGGQPKNISGPVVDFIRNGSPRNFFSCIVDEEYRMYVGTVTVNGVTYTNCEIIFNITTSAWRTREYFNDMTAYTEFNDSGVIRQYMGASSGEVYDKAKYTDTTQINADDGNPIGSNFELAPIWLGDLSNRKKLAKLIAFSERAQNLKIKGRVIDRNATILTPYKPIGELKKYVNSFDVDIEDGVLLQISGSEYGSFPYWSIFGFELEIIPQSEIIKE